MYHRGRCEIRGGGQKNNDFVAVIIEVNYAWIATYEWGIMTGGGGSVVSIIANDATIVLMSPLN